MATHTLESGALSAFCEGIAVMLSAGIQVDESLVLLSESMEEGPFKRACLQSYKKVSNGAALSIALRETGAFPDFLVSTIAVGEETGRLESALSSLSVHYSEESRLLDKVKTSIAYPAALLCIMTVILAFTSFTILPVFIDVYNGFAGSLTAGSFDAVNAAILIGHVSLGVTLVLAIISLIAVFITRNAMVSTSITPLLESLPFTKRAMKQMAVSRFTSSLSTYIASGINTTEAMENSMRLVENRELRQQLQTAYDTMVDPANPRSLTQTLQESGIYEPVYARMLMAGKRSGRLDSVLDSLSEVFFDDAVTQIDRSVDNIEPALAAFMTIAVGATLISVMLPLIGIMASIA